MTIQSDPVPSLNNDQLRQFWRKEGGSFHGPNVETGTMPESSLLPMLRRILCSEDRALWQPISTAPKDGKQILLSNGLVVAEGLWINDEGGTIEHRDIEGRYVGQDDRDGYIGWMDYDGGMTPEPTHWMPLPEAPCAVLKADREQRPAALSEADPEQQEWVISGGGLPDLSNRAIELRQHGYKLLERVTDMNLSSTDRYTAEKELNRVLSQLADLLIDPPAVKPTREQRRAHDAEYLAHGVEATRTGRVT